MSSVRVHHNGCLFFDFRYQGQRCREYTRLKDSRANRLRMEKALKQIDAEITLGTFDYAKTFPNSNNASRFSIAVPALPSAAHPRQLPTTPDLKKFAEEWYTEREVGWKRSYIDKVNTILDVHLIPKFGELSLVEICKGDILKFRSELAKEKTGKVKTLSPSRVNQILNLLKQILDEAAERYHFTSPYRGIKPLRLPRSDVDPFSLDEVESFLATLPSAWRNYFIVRFFTGMRTSEIDGLKWKYVDFARGEIEIRETLVHGLPDTPKTDGSTRIIQISTTVRQALEAQHKLTSARCEYVFCTSNNQPLQYNNVNNRVWYPTLEKAGLKRRKPYQTRHTAATLWLAAGESPEWIARQMGHSNTKMLFTVYSRYVPNLTRQDGSAMERLLSNRFSSTTPAHSTADSTR